MSSQHLGGGDRRVRNSGHPQAHGAFEVSLWRKEGCKEGRVEPSRLFILRFIILKLCVGVSVCRYVAM